MRVKVKLEFEADLDEEQALEFCTDVGGKNLAEDFMAQVLGDQPGACVKFEAQTRVGDGEEWSPLVAYDVTS